MVEERFVKDEARFESKTFLLARKPGLTGSNVEEF